jgi:NAD(P)-dependent dehydrogenase (short-subunit alcohol dehydrogenase family)
MPAGLREGKLAATFVGMNTVRLLTGKIAVVAGATRAAGRGIARMLGEAGATVYCSGRSTRGRPATPGRPETIEETAEFVSAAGGRGIAVRADHSNADEVASLFSRVIDESGRVDILVNDIWGGDGLTERQPFWTLDSAKGFEMLDRAVRGVTDANWRDALSKATMSRVDPA